MLDNLINLVKQNAGTAIFNNPAIPNERNEEAVKETSNSIMTTLQNALSGDGLKQVLGMFGKGNASANDDVVKQATGNVTQHLQEKLNLDKDQAAGVAGNLVPNVMNQLAQKTANPSDSSFDLQSIFNQLSGGKTSNMNVSALLSKFSGGLDKDGDGDVDLNDLKAMFGGTGSMMDKVKGLFN